MTFSGKFGKENYVLLVPADAEGDENVARIEIPSILFLNENR